MKISFYKSLAFKLSILILLIEVVILTISSVIYYRQFAQQVDARVEGRLQLPASLLENNLLRVVSIRDRETMTLLLGEDVQEVLIIEKNGDVLFTMNDTYRNRNVHEIAELSGYLNDFSDDNKNSIYRDQIDEQNFLVNISDVNIASPTQELTYTIFIRTRIDSSEAEKKGIARVLFTGSLLIISFTTVGIIFFFNRLILKPVNVALQVLQMIRNGDLTARVRLPSAQDEMNILLAGFNEMIRQVEDLINTLEQRVRERTRDLGLASDVSKRITTVLDLNELLQQVVVLTNTSFNLYYSTIFLVDENQQTLQRMASANRTGEKVDEVTQTISLLAEPSVVALAARKRAHVLISDVQHSPLHMSQSSLSETRTELAIPVMLADKLLGVFDLQSDKPGRFSEENLRLLQSLAEQIAIAVQNAQLFEAQLATTDKLRVADRVKSQFLASMSHELRTPLNAIINYSWFIVKGKLGPTTSKQEEALTTVVNSGNHLLNLINDVLDISKIEAGSLELFIQHDIDLKKELQAAVETATTLLTGKNVALNIQMEENVPCISGDRQRILQIILNILSNACKFTEEGSITLRTYQHDHEVVIAVQDTGPGIAPEDYEAVFESFRQTEVGLKQGGGTGLGMAISKRLTEAHGGRLWFESQVGKGSTFYVALSAPGNKETE